MPFGSVISVSICMLGMLLPYTPTISAGASTGHAGRSQIRQRKERIVRSSQTSETVMLGAIQYIDQISSGRGTVEMTATRDRYRSLVHAIQSMDDEPSNDTEHHLHDLEVTFFSQIKEAMTTFHGTTTALWEAVTAVRSRPGLQNKNRERITPRSDLLDPADLERRAPDEPHQQYLRQFLRYPPQAETWVTSHPGTAMRTPVFSTDTELPTLY